MEDPQDEYRIVEDDSGPGVRISPRCSVVKISCGFIPKDGGAGEVVDVTPGSPAKRGDPYTVGELDAKYRNAMSLLESLFETDLDDPEQAAAIMEVRRDMAHYRVLIDRFSERDE